jgi:GH15 family glucan-1,4-alpha-glucosidase
VDDGFDGAVGAFVPACWWAVSALAQLGRVTEAHGLADELCRALPGLQPEILGTEPLGNLPLVWSHAEATRALYLLRAADIRARWGSAGLGLWRATRMARSLVQRSGRTERSQKARKPA